MNAKPNILDELHRERLRSLTRRQFFGRSATGLGGVALAALLNENLFAAKSGPLIPANLLAPRQPHFPAKARRMIYLHMAGAPSHLDLFDYKPKLVEMNGEPCPES